MSTGGSEVLPRIREYIETTFAGRFEVYDLSLKTVNRRLILEVVIDGPEGIKVKDCETVSRTVSKLLDDTDLIHRQFTLEVSSPGAERLLKRPVDFERQKGRLVRWVLRSTEADQKEVFKGRLQESDGTRVVVLADEGRREFPLTAVVEARVVLEFPSKPKRG